jgi:formylmethanofuran dehydrogenase subunit E
MENENKIVPFSDVTKFHGHACPGSALGYRVAEVAMSKLNSSQSKDEELIAVVENDSCAVDAVQVVTGCTFGKGNLVFKDYGKHVYTFFNRNTGGNIRIYLKANFDELVPEFPKARSQAFGDSATNEDMLAFEKYKALLIEKILNASVDELFNLSNAQMELPEKASIYKSVKCEECGELVSEHRIVDMDGKTVCMSCFEKFND